MWTNNCKTTIQGQSYCNANERWDGAFQASDWELSHFPILTHRGVKQAYHTPGSDQMTTWTTTKYRLQSSPKQQELNAGSHGDYEHESKQILYK